MMASSGNRHMSTVPSLAPGTARCKIWSDSCPCSNSETDEPPVKS